jgi:hypothetical protein
VDGRRRPAGWLLCRYVPELGDILEAASAASDDADDRAPR